jgi:hypothetical protein
MGIDYSGGMIVGAHAEDIDFPDVDSIYEWIEDNGLDTMSEYYDADIDQQYIGFCVDDIAVEDIEKGWLVNVKNKAKEFEALTGTKAKLIGTQDIW